MFCSLSADVWGCWQEFGGVGGVFGGVGGPLSVPTCFGVDSSFRRGLGFLGGHMCFLGGFLGFLGGLLVFLGGRARMNECGRSAVPTCVRLCLSVCVCVRVCVHAFYFHAIMNPSWHFA